MPRRFESKKDLWLSAVAWATVLAMALTAWQALTTLTGPERLVALAVSLVTAAFIVWLWCGTRYEVGDGRLTIRAGPFRWHIDCDEITAVTPTRAAWSSPALSLDRLRIEYGDGKWVLVSPQQREAFAAALGHALH